MTILKKSKEILQTEIAELRRINASTKIPSNIQQTVNKELEALSDISAEYTSGFTYIDLLLGLPWDKKTKDNLDLYRAERVLNERHYGLNKIKERILEHLAVKTLRKNRILVVDDERIALRSLERALKKEGYAVVAANSGVAAVEILEHSEFDVVMTDLKMEKVDGMDVIEKTKSKYPDSQVIMITGYASVDTAIDAIRMGAVDYIEKPIKLDKVRSLVKKALEKKSITRTVKGSVLCFAGPSGTGKTSLGKGIADVLGRKFARIPLKEIKDEAEIIGRKRTSAGSAPGCIIEEIRRTGYANPVLMLDELDRIGQDFKGDPVPALLEVLDPEQNENFTDHYLDMPFDLSNVMFIATAESADNIQNPLKEFMEVIEFSGYTDDEKIKIALNHLIPDQIRIKDLSDHPPECTPEAISEIIQGYTQEAGIKDLERQIAVICRKIANELVYPDEILQNIKLGPELVEKYLGPRKY